MGNRSTGLALVIMGIEILVALLLIYIAVTRTDIHDPMLGAVLGGLMLMSVFAMLIFFYASPGNRRVVVFFLVFMGMVLLPGTAYMIMQATTDIRIDLDGPNSPSPFLLLPYILLIAWMFIRLASWAMAFGPVPGSNPVSAQVLRQRMLIMNDSPEFPFTIKPGKRADELIMDWKYADATWFDLMRLHRMSSLARFVIRIDESDRTMRVRESQSQFDASAGLGRLSLSFNAQWGAITFYEFRRETFYGVQIENGWPVAKLSYTYQFDIREMREPLQHLATGNGWTFMAVPLFGKWLTG